MLEKCPKLRPGCLSYSPLNDMSIVLTLPEIRIIVLMRSCFTSNETGFVNKDPVTDPVLDCLL